MSAWLYINRLYYNCTMICIVVFIDISMYLLIYQYNHFWCWSHVFINFILWSFNNSFSNNRFSFVMCWIHFYIIILQPWFNWSIVKLTVLSNKFLFGLQLASSKNFRKVSVIVIPFYSFKGITHAYLLKISITHNKKTNSFIKFTY